MRPAVKIISILLLQVLTLVPAFYLFVFQAHQRSIRHRMEERMEEEMLHSMVIPKSELKWVKPGKEIILGEHYFDIKSITEQDNGFVLITGIYDYEEGTLVEQMKKEKQEENSQGSKLVQLVQLMQALPGTEPGEGLIPLFLSRSWPAFKDPKLSTPFRNILTPPPQV